MRPRVDLWLARADQSQVMSRKSCLINLLPGDRNQPIPGSCLSGDIVFKRVVAAGHGLRLTDVPAAANRL